MAPVYLFVPWPWLDAASKERLQALELQALELEMLEEQEAELTTAGPSPVA